MQKLRRMRKRGQAFYSSYEKQAMGKLLKRFINRVEQTIDDVVYRVKCKFSQDDNRSKNIQLVQQKCGEIWTV